MKIPFILIIKKLGIIWYIHANYLYIFFQIIIKKYSILVLNLLLFFKCLKIENFWIGCLSLLDKLLMMMFDILFVRFWDCGLFLVRWSFFAFYIFKLMKIMAWISELTITIFSEIKTFFLMSLLTCWSKFAIIVQEEKANLRLFF